LLAASDVYLASVEVRMRRLAWMATVVSMTNLIVTERPRRTAIRASWLFDGTGSGLIADPVVVSDGTTIRSAESGGDAPEGARVADFDGATLLPGGGHGDRSTNTSSHDDRIAARALAP
jgi:hypothetical protein